MRWVWLDRFEEFYSRKSARAVKLVSFAEDHVHEQFPAYPVFPHSLVMEGLAQTGGILLGEANDFKEKVVLAKIPKAVFHGHATPGDRLDYCAELLELRPEGGIVALKALKNGELMVDAEIVYAHLDQAREDPLGVKNFVFSKEHLISLLKTADGSYRAGIKGASDQTAEGGSPPGQI
ncbi:MAG TPA: beta-hydroxyacyl-ACP dehydratase [Planctomycetia bacterium]|nr:beta-hydroxyacyl-ACP dehydratase [Planctomycetia bacterium]